MADEINIDDILETTIQEAFKELGMAAVPIKQQYYLDIKYELDEIAKFLIIKQQSQRKIRGGLINPYAPEFGFSQDRIAYQILDFKKNSSIVYNRLNKILSYFRAGQEINYALYIKDASGHAYRYEVPESEIDNFTSIVQSTTFKADQDLRQYAESALERLENAAAMSKHLDDFMSIASAAISNTGLKLGLGDLYEGFEYHYQKVDSNIGDFTHGFNSEGIRNWYLGRAHDTAGWWVRGDIGLTSVKSVNLQNKYLFLNLASQNSLSKVYTLLKEIFQDNLLTPDKLNKIARAFTPIIYDAKRGINNDIQKIINDLLSSLTT